MDKLNGAVKSHGKGEVARILAEELLWIWAEADGILRWCDDLYVSFGCGPK